MGLQVEGQRVRTGSSAGHRLGRADRRTVRRLPVLAAVLGLALAGVLAVRLEPAPPLKAEPLPASAAAPPGPPAAPAFEIPKPPPVGDGAKVYAVLDKHCARCHQVGKLIRPRPAGDLADILAIERIAADRSLVVPGEPDISRLCQIFISRERHFDDALDNGEGEAVRANEAMIIRDFIKNVPRDGLAACEARAPIRAEDLSAAIEARLAAPPDPGAGAATKPAVRDPKALRYVSLAALFNACVSPSELEGYRQAVGKLLNSLSWSAAPVRLESFGPGNALIEVPLADLGWVPAHWERLVDRFPFVRLPALKVSDHVVQATGTQLPMLPADWLAAALSWPKLYHEMLGLPATELGLERLLQAEVRHNIERALARRAAVRDSEVVKGPRIVERHPSRFGSLWLSYDFANLAGERNVFEHPLGPAVAPPGAEPFKPDGLRALFTLPNGFFAYLLFGATGERRDEVAASVDREPAGWGQPVATGALCMACHLEPVKPARDQMRQAVEANASLPKPVRDAALLLYADAGEFERLAAEDRTRFETAMRQAGLDPGLRVNGLEPIAALARAYAAPSDGRAAAAEFGVPRAEFEKRLDALSGDARLASRRLVSGLATRSERDRIFSALLKLRPGEAAADTVPLPSEGPPSDLEVWSDKRAYAAGDLATFTVHSGRDCHLTLIDIDPAGQAIVLFPNDFDTNDLVVRGKDLNIPADTSAFQFRVKTPGTETLMASCVTGEGPGLQVEYDFERERFRVLGEWRGYLDEHFDVFAGRLEADKARRPAKAAPGAPPARVPATPSPAADSVTELRRMITFEVK